jgi:hypothetical protein
MPPELPPPAFLPLTLVFRWPAPYTVGLYPAAL